MSQRRQLLRTTGLLGVLTLVSRITGLLRDVVLAALLGGSRTADVFYIAFQLPNLARRVLGEGALSSFIVPLFVGRRKESGNEEGWIFVNRTLNAVFLLTLVMTLLGMLFSREVFNLFGGLGILTRAQSLGGTEEAAAIEAARHGVALTRLMFPYMIGLAVSSVMMGVCHGLNRFATAALGSTVLNIAMITAGAAALFLAVDPQRATVWLAASVLAGAVIRILIMTPTLAREGWRWGTQFSTRDPEVRKLFRMMGVGLFGLGITQINIAVALFFAAFLGEGNVTYLTCANRLIQFPMALTATAMATAMLPNLTQLLLDGEHAQLRRVMGFAKRIEVVLMFPAMLGLIFFGLPIVELLFERGAFTPEDSIGTQGALVYYALGLLPLGWLRLILPIFYARKDVTTPVKAAFVSMIVNIVLGAGFTFFTSMEQRGLALASTLAAFVNYGILQLYLHRDPVKPLAESRLTETLLKSSIAGLIGVGLPWLLYQFVIHQWGTPEGAVLRASFLVPVIALSIPLYFAFAHLFRVPESDRAVELIRKRLTRK